MEVRLLHKKYACNSFYQLTLNNYVIFLESIAKRLIAKGV